MKTTCRFESCPDPGIHPVKMRGHVPVYGLDKENKDFSTYMQIEVEVFVCARHREMLTHWIVRHLSFREPKSLDG